MSQAPQCCTLVVVSTQLWPHCTRLPHDVAHVPAAHTSPAPHATPQPPQLAASDITSTQLDAHGDRPLTQLHRAAEQKAPVVQLVPQAPQFPVLVARSTHTPPQLVPPSGQSQLPPVHVMPGAQRCWQPPQ
jgi:hypothetical protein